jgi:Ca2+-transporting ATPase
MTHPSGLTSIEARHRLTEYGPNALPEPRPDPPWRRFVRQFRSPLIYILLCALVVDLAVWLSGPRLGLPWEALAISVILVFNAALGVWQERKAEAAVAKLKHLSAPQVWTLRDGTLVRLPSAELVPGDVVRLESGDRVAADAVAALAENLLVDESVVTGESLPVDKRAGSDLFAGTLVARGKTYAEVTRTGARSTMGRLAEMLGTVQDERTPLERRLEALGHRVARWIVGLALVIALGGLWAEGLARFGHVLLFAVALAVAAVPEGLPAVLTVTLALGVERMARRRAVVRRLTAVEALGSVTVIATDKTGTLTENRMEVRDIETADRERALKAMVLANDAEPGIQAGDPLELALLTYADPRLGDLESVRRAHPRASSRAFDSAAKFMRVTVREADGLVSFVKGAPEVLLERSALPEPERASWHRRVEAYGAEGYRVLALACGEGERETELEWLGLVLLWDPPRPEVAGAVQRARAAGIRVLMITGDHPATARTLARTVGIDHRRVMSGAEVPDPSALAALRGAVRDTGVFARVTPEQKLAIVEALKAEGEIVAVTGDGVNDAPALKRSDVGVAMGQRGSDVAREVADLVLLDDNFATIVAAIEEGRSIYENIQKFIRFLFSTNVSEVLVVTIGATISLALNLRDAAGGLLLPLTAAQLLWINLVTDGAPALAMGLDRNPGVMQRPPRNPGAPLLDRASLRFVWLSGGAKAIIAFAILGLLPAMLTASVEVTQTATFFFLAAGQLLFAYPARHTDLWPARNHAVHLAVAGGFVAQILVVLVPGLRAAFDAVALPLAAWVWVAGSVLLTWGVAEATSRLVWASGTRSVTGADLTASEPTERRA